LLSNFAKNISSQKQQHIKLGILVTGPKTGIPWQEFYGSHTLIKMEWTQAKL